MSFIHFLSRISNDISSMQDCHKPLQIFVLMHSSEVVSA